MQSINYEVMSTGRAKLRMFQSSKQGKLWSFLRNSICFTFTFQKYQQGTEGRISQSTEPQQQLVERVEDRLGASLHTSLLEGEEGTGRGGRLDLGRKSFAL